MRYFSGTADFYSDVPSAVTMGKFDGMHLGHQKLVKRILREKANGLISIVFIIAPSGQPRLLTCAEERSLLEKIGVDLVIECPFIPEILHMTADEFVRDVLVKKLKAVSLAVGPDFRFGYLRSGDDAFLAAKQEEYGYSLNVLEKECFNGREISSTFVREALVKGDISLANRLLGYPFPITGTVVHGKALGSKMGMPTANLIPGPEKLLPPNGVYFCRVNVDGKMYNGISNIGRKPTVDGSFTGVETYLYGSSLNLYGKQIQVSLLKFVRPEQKFHSVEELKAHMEQDLASGEAFFHEW